DEGGDGDARVDENSVVAREAVDPDRAERGQVELADHLPAGHDPDVLAHLVEEYLDGVGGGAAGDEQIAVRLDAGRHRVGARGVGGDLAEQAVRLVPGAGGEVEGVGVAGRGAVAEDQAPQPVDVDR